MNESDPASPDSLVDHSSGLDHADGGYPWHQGAFMLPEEYDDRFSESRPMMNSLLAEWASFAGCVETCLQSSSESPLMPMRYLP